MAFVGIDDRTIGDHLVTALSTDQSWLRAALVAPDPDDHTPLTDDQLDWLTNVADYRSARNVTGRSPLGGRSIDIAARDDFFALLDDLDRTRILPELQQDDRDLDVGIEL